MTQRQRAKLWGLLVVILAVAALGVVLWLSTRVTEAKITWRYSPSPPQPDLPLLYAKPQGGIFAARWQEGLITFDAAGLVVGEFTAPAGIRIRQGVVDAEGTFYVGGTDGKVRAFSSDGALRWACEIPDQCSVNPHPPGRSAFPNLGADGLLHVVLNTGECAVLSRDGSILRRFDIGVLLSTVSPLAFAPDGGYYAIAYPKDVIRVTAEGKELWRFPTHGFTVMKLQSDAQGTAYLVAHQDRFYALAPEGTVKWEYVNPDPLHGAAFHWYSYTLGSDGTVYISSDNRLTSFDSNGKQLWSQTLNGRCADVLIGNGQVYVQPTISSISSRMNNYLSRLTLKLGWHLPANIGYGPQQLFKLDPASGRVVQRWKLAPDVLLDCGPGPQGEFYGDQIDFSPGTANSYYELIRVDLP